MLTALDEQEPGFVRLRVEPIDGLWETEVVMDGARGYLPVGTQHRSKGRPNLYTYEVTEAQEVSPGLWYPTTLGQWETVWIYTGVQLNRQIGDSTLEVVFPPGTEVDDQIAGTRFVVADPATGLAPDASNDARVDLMDTNQSLALASHLDRAARMMQEFAPPDPLGATASPRSRDAHLSRWGVIGWGAIGAVTAAAPVGVFGLLKRRRNARSA